MSVLVFIESAGEEVKKTSLEAVLYGSKLAEDQGGDVHVMAIGKHSEDALAAVGGYGASKVFYAESEELSQGGIQAYAKILSDKVKNGGYKFLVMAKSSLSEPVSARVSVSVDGALASNVVDLPDTSSGFVVTRSIYTGKAFAKTELKGEVKIISLKKNAVNLEEGSGTAEVEKVSVELPEDLMKGKVTGQEVAEGDILLPEAEFVVSGGRGLKGPENWGMIEDLAKTLGAATACSKPVSDMEWRPHHEHVGQTGIKISPNLYIAVGISGAIQHLAGVNSSKVIVVVNKDPEAPFFKAADYGIAADAFEVMPKLTEAFKKALN